MDIEKLNKIKDEYSKIIQKKRIMVCSGTGCTSSKSDVLLKNIQDKLEKDGIKNITAHKTGCFGFCAKGPIVVIDPDEIFYELVKPEDADDIVKAVINNKVVERLLVKENEKYVGQG